MVYNEDQMDVLGIYNVYSYVYTIYIFTWWIGPNISVKNKYNNII